MHFLQQYMRLIAAAYALLDSGGPGDRVQLQHCCEMVVKLGNKSLEESQKLDQQTELLTLMQQRLEAVAAELQEERRDRIKLEVLETLSCCVMNRVFDCWCAA